MRAYLGIAIVFAAAACDSRASATDPQVGARAEQKSKEYESCSATMHCQDELRCFDQVCRRTNRSTVGDYQAALGTAASARGEHDAAVAAFEAANGHYQTERLSLPPDIDCAYGAALAAAREVKKEYADRAARVLHRCVLGVPPSGGLRERALANLATLAPLGLDPLALGGGKPADTYLTKGEAKPSGDKVNVAVNANPTPSGKSWPKVVEKLTGELKPALIACWEKHAAAAKKDELTVTATLKVAYIGNPDYEGEGSFVTKLELGATPEETCVKTVIEKPIKQLQLTDAMNSKVAITIK